MATSTPPGNSTNLGIDPKVAALLCNVPGCCGVGVLFSIVAVIVEKQNKLVRFHALQSLLLNGAGFVAITVLWVLSVVLGALAGPLGALMFAGQVLVLLALVGVSIFLMVKANVGEEFELPVIGKMARQWV